MRPHAFVLRLAAGHYDSCPFRSDDVERTVEFMRASLGLNAAEAEVTYGQSFRLDMVSALLKVAVDLDWSYFLELTTGVSLCIGKVMPRALAVFEQKTKRKL